MIILALDTTENTATAALLSDETPLAAETLGMTKTHSETMLPIVAGLLEKCGRTYDDIDLYAVSAGPGSFTGVRIGAAVVKGLAFGKGKPCVGVSALEALAENLRGIEGILCPGMDARRGQLYNALFEGKADGTVTRLTPDRTVSAEELAAELAETYAGRTVYFCGGGYEIMKKACEGKITVGHTPAALIPESGISVGLTARRTYLADPEGTYDDRTLQPTYLRPSQAERNRNKEN